MILATFQTSTRRLITAHGTFHNRATSSLSRTCPVTCITNIGLPSSSSSSALKMSTTTGSTEDKPKPQIFAIMRNGHEVIRGSVADIKEAVEQSDMESAKDTWEKLKKWGHLHKMMEESDGKGVTPKGLFKYVFV